MTAPDYHGRTHAPGGTDPIPSAAGWVPKWATAVMFLTSTTKSGAYYYATFSDMGTNDTDAFTLETADWGTALGINLGGYYHCWFGITTGGDLSGDWGVNYAILDPIFEEGGAATPLNTEVDTLADYEQDTYGIGQEQFAAEQPASQPRHRGKSTFMGLHYDPPSPSVGNFGFESPLKLGVRMLTDQTGSVGLTAQIHVLRVADAGYTAVSA